MTKIYLDFAAEEPGGARQENKDDKCTMLCISDALIWVFTDVLIIQYIPADICQYR